MKRASTPPVSSAGARALAVYEAWMREQEALATASIRNYVSDLSHFIAWYEQRATQAAGDTGVLFSPREITTAELLRYRDVLQEREQKPASINRALLSLKRYFHWACSQQLVSSDPSVPVKLVGEPSVPPRQLSDQEELALIEAVNKYGTLRDRTMILLLLHTGLRASELCGLRPDQIRLGEGSGHLCVVDTRNNTRSVPLDTTAYRALLEYLPSLQLSRRGSFFRRRRTTPYRKGRWDILSRNMLTWDSYSLRSIVVFGFFKKSRISLIDMIKPIHTQGLSTTLSCRSATLLG